MYSYKFSFFLIFLSIHLNSFAQTPPPLSFGTTTPKQQIELAKIADRDAPAAIIYERGYNYYELMEDQNYIALRKEVHRKIVVLDAAKFNGSSIEILLYKADRAKETIESIEAVTHNQNIKNYVKASAIYTQNYNENFDLVRFAFPDVKDGSVIEYKYSIRSPFTRRFDNWKFQHELPTLYSEFTSKIPGNFEFRKILRANRPLDIHETKVEKKSFHIRGYTSASQGIETFAMKNVPAFKEEKYMLSKENYLMGIEFELKEMMGFDGVKSNYLRSWEDVDAEFKKERDSGKQLRKSGYFEKNIPTEILSIHDDLERAKAIYTFIQNTIKWNGEWHVFDDVRVKDAFKDKTGNNSEINLALINALNAANLDAKLVLIASRDYGIPTEDYPVLSDFNHSIAQVTIATKTYLLDAIDPLTPFGVLPFNDLNMRGRVMDFKKGSYWTPLTPHKKNVLYVNAKLKANNDGSFQGALNESYLGYLGTEKRREISNSSTTQNIKNIEMVNSNWELSEFNIDNVKQLDLPLKLDYSVTLETDIVGEKVYLSPYFFDLYIKENPFKLKERTYPVDLGYPIINTYLISLDLGTTYKLEKLPENKAIQLSDGAGVATVVYNQMGSVVNIRFNFKLKEYQFDPSDYESLKKLFQNVIDIQNKDIIVLKKV
ncbi:DUF3857 domain-containing protein [Cochleicola gelatinilyticus]|uniref:DUF3857 domain-containing protein n=1 Tax=Cochleicola gelatinilyticus TaxID=1763537 RepID=A0A167KF62_9FLAO|nr:DUF3857 domain-containing protein [Cochleicola gelatinilyticus]OAB81826.1 hypothetical protein ULVI_00365 [Cochleicola gelatinilyticus]